MSKNSGRSVIAVRCGARWVTSMPQAIARSTWAVQLAVDLVRVGVLPQVVDGRVGTRPRRKERRGVGDRPPSVASGARR